MPDRDEEGFLSRWSRRKRKREGDDVESTEDVAQSEAAPDPEAFEADDLPRRVLETPEDELSATEREWLENRRQAQEIDLEALAYESDFQPFLKRGVPRSLRRQAMRKLWGSNPVLANLDGLNDYEEDFGDPALNTFTSIWQVGRGYLTASDRSDRPTAVPDAGTGEPEDEIAEAAPPPADEEPQDQPETRAETGESAEPHAEETSEPDEENPVRRVSLRRRLDLD